MEMVIVGAVVVIYEGFFGFFSFFFASAASICCCRVAVDVVPCGWCGERKRRSIYRRRKKKQTKKKKTPAEECRRMIDTFFFCLPFSFFLFLFPPALPSPFISSPWPRTAVRPLFFYSTTSASGRNSVKEKKKLGKLRSGGINPSPLPLDPAPPSP